MGAIIGIALVLIFIAMPFVTLAKISGLAAEIRELKMLLGILIDSRAKTKDKTNVEVVPNVKSTPEPVATPLVPPHVPAMKKPKEQLQQQNGHLLEPLPVPGPKLAPVLEPMPESVPEPMPEPLPEPAPEPMNQPVVRDESEMSAFDIFWAKFEDWFCVRGDFAPKGTTREFAVATRWLTRVGAVLLVGAIAYFLVLAIDKGWIGPVQRVYGMMAWGVIGTVFGTWLKLKSERYAILGEVCAAVGLVALYLSFGLGHRYFKPPVITSGYVAFAGLFVATITAGALSVRLKSLMIAGLALVGGFLVPTICSFTNHDVQLHVYLFLLSIGTCAVACLRGWTLYGFAGIVVSALFSQVKCGSCFQCNVAVAYLFYALEYALFLALTVRASVREGNANVRPCYWVAAAIAGVFCLCKLGTIAENHFAWHGAWALHHLGWAVAFAVLAALSRRRAWGGTPVFVVFACVCAAFALGTACFDWWRLNNATSMLLFCLFAALLVELGARSEDRTLQVAAFLATVVMSFAGFFYFAINAENVGGGYAHDLVDRMQYLWPVPALVAFAGWRLGERAFWVGWLRGLSYRTAAVMSFVILTAESHFFGREFLPVLRGGFVTIVWAVVASALLASGIVRRVKVARLVGLGVLTLSVVKLLFVDTASLSTPGRVGVFAAVGALLIVGAFLYLKFKAVFEEAGAEARHPEVEEGGKE